MLISCLLAVILYWRGMRARRANGLRTGVWRSISFFTGVLLIYAVMQTYIDYLSQHMFWVHRAQHLVLHHLGPFLLVLATPHEIMAQGLPGNLRKNFLSPLWNSLPVRACYLFLQNPVIAPVLFVGLIVLWLTPTIHFEAMLSQPRYEVMNWSMLIDGILFWWLMLDPRMPHEHRTLRYPVRILILWIVMVLQIIIGAYIGLSKHVLYDVYAVCGRAWPISPLTDQTIGGLTTWIPAAMMSVIAIILVIRMWMRQSKKQHELAMAQANNTEDK